MLPLSVSSEALPPGSIDLMVLQDTQDFPGRSPHLKLLNLITPTKSSFLHMVTVTGSGIEDWTSLSVVVWPAHSWLEKVLLVSSWFIFLTLHMGDLSDL